ncbi:MAG: hypothetical protein OJF51_003672 [Nitrospira sp.]|nr:MAG: hypothetical protein OJF51_003672 [Nitrospira sp.]
MRAMQRGKAKWTLGDCKFCERERRWPAMKYLSWILALIATWLIVAPFMVAMRIL